MEVLVKNRAVGGASVLPRWLLVAGLLTGAGLGAVGLTTGQRGGLPANAVARVNDRLISRDAFLRAVAAVAGERRGELSEADRRHILDRLVDEELLVQHGLALGLAEHDARLRDTMVSEVMVQATGAAAVTPLDDELRRFYAENQPFFAPATKLRLKAWRLDAQGVRSEFVPPLPDALLPLAKVQTYLGPDLTARAAELPDSAPTQVGSVLLQVLEREAGAAPAYEAIRDEVRREFKRRADEAAVRALLIELRRQANLTLAPPAE